MAGVKTEYTSSSCHGDPSDKRISENLNCGGEKKFPFPMPHFLEQAFNFTRSKYVFFFNWKGLFGHNFWKKKVRGKHNFVMREDYCPALWLSLYVVFEVNRMHLILRKEN